MNTLSPIYITIQLPLPGGEVVGHFNLSEMVIPSQGDQISVDKKSFRVINVVHYPKLQRVSVNVQSIS